MLSVEWSQTTKRIVVVGLVIVSILLLYVFRAVVPALLIAGVVAYILKPIADWVERRTRLRRMPSVLLVFLVLLVLLSLIPATILPYLVDQVARINVDLERLTTDIVQFLSRPIEILGFTLNPRDLIGDVQQPLVEFGRGLAGQTVSLLVGIASSLVWMLVTLFIAFYLVKDADQLRAFLDRLAPASHAEELRRLREDVSQVWSSFFRGQVVLAVVIGVVVWITMTAVGLPSAGLMALIAGFLEVVPNFGPVLATIPALLVALIRGSSFLPISHFWFAVLVLVIYALIQQVENAYLVPRVMGRRLQLHPVVVFIGVIAGGVAFGAVGIFLAAPVIATGRVLLRYTYAKLMDQPPFRLERGEPGELYPGEIDAILLDLDGTLAETDDQAVGILTRRLAAMRRLLPGRNPERTARRLIMACEGPAARILGILDRVGLDDDILGLAGRLRRLRCLHGALDLVAVDGIGEALRELHDRYHLAMVTTRSHREAEAFLDQQGLAHLFQVITARDDTWRIKPHPSPVRYTAERLGVPVERCLMVGDTVTDIKAARAAGARAAGVLCGFGLQEDLERAGADLTLVTTADLLEWL